jgi:hypothetical protein
MRQLEPAFFNEEHAEGSRTHYLAGSQAGSGTHWLWQLAGTFAECLVAIRHKQQPPLLSTAVLNRLLGVARCVVAFHGSLEDLSPAGFRNGQDAGSQLF